jgi:hypothetical protein
VPSAPQRGPIARFLCQMPAFMAYAERSVWTRPTLTDTGSTLGCGGGPSKARGAAVRRCLVPLM